MFIKNKFSYVKKLLFAFTFQFVCLTLLGQQNFPPTGAYQGVSINGAIGYYLLNNDSSFLFLGMKPSNQFTKKKMPYNISDTITTLGTGKWQIENNFIILKFLNQNLFPLLNSIVNYSCYTNSPFDSLILDIQINNKAPTLQNIFFIGTASKQFGSLTDTSGHAKLILPINFDLINVEISSPLFYTQSILIDKNCNIHKMKVTLTEKLDSEILELQKSDIFFRLKNNNTEFDSKIMRKINISKLKDIIFLNTTIYPKQITMILKLKDLVCE